MNQPNRNNPKTMTPDQATWEWLSKEKFKGKTVTQSYLKLMVILTTTGGLEFKVLQDTGTEIAGNRRLERSDAFWCTHMRFSIGKVASGASARSVIEHLFVNEYIFINAAEIEALNTLYNGFLSIQIANKLYFNYFDLSRFKRVGVAQEGLAASANATVNLYGEDSLDDSQGFLPMTPLLLFSGKSTPQINVTLPESVAMGGTAGTVNYGIIRFRGFYIADGANLGQSGVAE